MYSKNGREKKLKKKNSIKYMNFEPSSLIDVGINYIGKNS